LTHINFRKKFLQEAYAQAGSQPGFGWWHRSLDHENGPQTYECPFHLLYGASSVPEAIQATGAPRSCVASFLNGWDGGGTVAPDSQACQKCFRLGARLHAQLKPMWIARVHESA